MGVSPLPRRDPLFQLHDLEAALLLFPVLFRKLGRLRLLARFHGEPSFPNTSWSARSWEGRASGRADQSPGVNLLGNSFFSQRASPFPSTTLFRSHHVAFFLLR